jgi:CheY-like chemotaxis protein/two-component sensor histidine kinase
VATDLAAGKATAFPQANIRELASLSDAVTTLFVRERKARAESDAANSAKDEFLAMLGHELRNPIGAIANAVHIMDDEKRTQTDDLLARRVIVRQTEVLRRLIDDLLDIGRVLTGKIALEVQPLELSSCINRAVESLGAAGKTVRHRIEVNVSQVWIQGDATRMEQVLTNLIVNAVNHTPADGRIRIDLTRDEDEAVLTVSDTGVGIAAESLGKVFDLFYQEARQDDRPRGGLGIGLTLVRRLVELHGGTITASSAGTGKGATFTVRIAACTPHLQPVPERRQTPRSESRKVLIIEDNMDARETLRAALELQGHQVEAAADGPAGIERLNSFGPDAIVIDIGLPGMDGYAVARAIRAKTGTAARLIALTGYGLPEDEIKAAEAGFDAHLVKPADLARLSALLESAKIRRP